jgi:sialic acid synthase SpsE
VKLHAIHPSPFTIHYSQVSCQISSSKPKPSAKNTIGHQAETGYTALRDVLMQNTRTLWSKTKDLATGKPIIQGDTMEEVWVLKAVGFEITGKRPGVGITPMRWDELIGQVAQKNYERDDLI